jgi:DNA mismatch repair protein MSH5
MTDLQQISFALNQATNRSLLIVDEFGKGTNSTGMFTFTTPISNVPT